MSQESLLIIAALIFLVFALLRSSGEAKDRGRKPRHDEISEDLVTIASFPNPVAAHIARGKLESEGIECYVANDTLFSATPGAVWADGGVHLRVRESDAEKALKILSTRPLS